MKPQIVNTRNRMLSQNIYMTLDTKRQIEIIIFLSLVVLVVVNHLNLLNLTFYKCLALI